MSILIYFFVVMKIICFDIYNLSNSSENFNNTNEVKNNFMNHNNTNKRELEENNNGIKIYIEKRYLKYQLESDGEDQLFNIYNISLDRAKNALEKLIKPVYKSSNIELDINYDGNNFEGFRKSILESTSIVDNNNKISLSNYDLAILVRKKASQFDSDSDCNEKNIILKTDHGRPIFGYIVIEDKYGKYPIDRDDEQYLIEFYSYIFLHQFTHILGFNKTFLENRGITIRNKTISRNNNNLNINKLVIDNNNLRSLAQKYFGCNIELETEENDGCKEYIHWDYRILLGDYMTSLIYMQEQVISNFTLALLEETQLYKANYFTGGLMRFGKNRGCDFFQKDCNRLLEEWEKPNPNQTTTRAPIFKNEFCSGIMKTTCSTRRLSRGICYNHITTDIISSSKIQYKRNRWDTYGNNYADYCPISSGDFEIGDEDEKKYSYIGSCKFGKKNNYGMWAFSYAEIPGTYYYNVFNDSYGEVFSDHSFCAFSSVISKFDSREKKNVYQGFIRPTCYEMFCSNKSLTIKIGPQYIVCPRAGGYINIGGDYEGNLLCPDFYLICSQTVPCNNLFDCVEKESREINIADDYIKPDNDISVQIVLPFDFNVTIYPNAYEEDDYGRCPIHCSECKENKQCFECDQNFSIYIGVRENDNNPIICSKEKPSNGSYYNTIIQGKIYYFQCIEHCFKCHLKDKCDVCYPQYIIRNDECVEKIEGCELYNEIDLNKRTENDENNGGGMTYNECLQCNKTKNYYCLGTTKQTCVKIDNIKPFYYNNFSCLEKCSDSYNLCEECNNVTCTKCQTGYYVGYEGKCYKNISYCSEHDVTIKPEPSHCNKCIDNYRCLGDDKTKCLKIDNLNLYYTAENGVCVKECSQHFNNCLSCDISECKNCLENYFVYEDDKTKCIERIPFCDYHYYKIQGGEETKYCINCREDYYCFYGEKEKCEPIEPPDTIQFYFGDILESVNGKNLICYEKCSDKFGWCLECTKDECKKCANFTKKEGVKCNIDPESEIASSCSIKLHEINTPINKIKLKDYPFYYYENLPYFKIVDHYLNKDYTITVFIYSECTDELLNQGYFKIDSEDLKKDIANYFTVNEKVIFSIFVTHNLKSHYIFYDKDLNYLNTTKYSNYNKRKDYIITNKYLKNINETLGALVASLIELEKINIFEKESSIFNNYCQNITFLGIDMPLKQRLLLLYPHKFSNQIACFGESCVIKEYNFDESEVTCNCEIGNVFEDLLTENTFVHFEGPAIEPNNFIESIGIIKCTGNGFNSKNLKANPGLFLCIIGIIAQIVLYIFYSLCSEPITNLTKGASNPPKKAIMIFSDWDKRINKKNETEGEVFIQPRDDADEQLLEEERTYSNDNDGSSISIDTNVGGMNNKKSGKNKLSEKPDRKVLILLKNKGPKSKKHNKDYEDLKSDSEFMKLNDESNIENISFCKIYWSIVSLKQHIINYFSFIHCCKITKSFIPLSIRIIRSIFIFFLSFVFNILFLNQSYFEKKFNHFNEKYIFIHAENSDLKVSSGERISYALTNTFIYALISFILLIIVNFITGFLFFSVRNSVGEIIKNNNISEIDNLILKTKKKYLIFFIINIVLMVIFFLTITGFVGAYGGGFVDYFVAGIISLIFFEIFPFLWSLIIALFTYLGNKNKNQCMIQFGKFFMF